MRIYQLIMTSSPVKEVPTMTENTESVTQPIPNGIEQNRKHRNGELSVFKKFWEKHSDAFHRSIGLILAAASGLLMTFYSALYKIVKSDIDNSTVLLIRGIIQITVMAVITSIKGTTLSPKKMEEKSKCQKGIVWIIFILVAVVGGIRLCFLFAALERIPIAVVHTILNGSPVLVMVLGHFILKDSCNVLRMLSTGALLAGVFLIFQPHALFKGNGTQQNSTSCDVSMNDSSCNSTLGSSSNQTNLSSDLLGYIFSVCALVFSSTGSVLTKKISQQFDKLAISFYLGITISIFAWIQLMFFGAKAPINPTTFFPWIIAIIVAALGVAQQFCLIAALKFESATRVTVVRSLNIVVSFAIQVVAWNERPGIEQIAGAAIVLSAIFVVTLEKSIYGFFRRCTGREEDVDPVKDVVIDRTLHDCEGGVKQANTTTKF